MIKKEMKLMEEAELDALNEIDDSSVEDAKKFDAVVKAFVEDVKGRKSSVLFYQSNFTKISRLAQIPLIP